MKQYCIIVGDTNDADYITEKTEITDEEILELKWILSRIGSGDSNWNTRYELDENDAATIKYKDIFTNEQFTLMNKFVPSAEYGIHTIESVEILLVQKEYKLL